LPGNKRKSLADHLFLKCRNYLKDVCQTQGDIEFQWPLAPAGVMNAAEAMNKWKEGKEGGEEDRRQNKANPAGFMDKLRDELNSKFFTTPSWNKKF
jgi:hypothetical protein